MVLLLNNVYIYQTDPLYENIRKGNIFELLGYGIPFAIAFILFEKYIHHLFDESCEKSFLGFDKYTTTEARKKRSYTLVKMIYSNVFYFFTSASGYLILK